MVNDPQAKVSVALDAGDHLGEGPFWDERTGELLRVDITNGAIHGWSPARGSAWTHRLDGEVGAVVPRAGAEGWVAACGHRLVLDDGTVLAEVEADLPANRFNDCKCDPQGRLWAGTMSKQRRAGTAALYRLDAEGPLTRVLEGTTISNGLGWSPEGERMYFIDSPTQRIDVLDFDGATGTVSNRRGLAEVAREDGAPDGMAVDAEDGVWVCLFGGGQLRRYDDTGRLDEVVELPVSCPTSPVFGGPRLGTLYVTSSRHRLTEEQLQAEPEAGAVFELTPGVRGLPGNRFAG
jgi:sugar lactone lactonase YvrE